MMAPNQLPAVKDLPFRCGDMVLARYSCYPYWPATIVRNYKKRFKGKHFTMRPTRGHDRVLCFWCSFTNEATGGWVRADRMVLFHPLILNKMRVDKDSEWYDDQKEAIDCALKAFQFNHKSKYLTVPRLPADLEQGKHKGMGSSTDTDDVVSEKEDSCAEDEEDAPSPKRGPGRPPKAGKIPARKKPSSIHTAKPPKRVSLPPEKPPTKKRSKTSDKHEQRLGNSVHDKPRDPVRNGYDRHVEEEVIDSSFGKGERNSPVRPDQPLKNMRDLEVEPASAQETMSTLKNSPVRPDEPLKNMRNLEAELASAQDSISTVKKSLEKQEKALAELAGDVAGVACVVPPLPPPNQEPLLGRDKYRSVPINPNMLGKMMDILMDDYDGFKKAAEAAHEVRTKLQKTMENIKKIYHNSLNKVSMAEENMTKKDDDVTGTDRQRGLGTCELV